MAEQPPATITERTLPYAAGDVPAHATIGRFVALGVIGAGGMGVVIAAHDPELDRKVAIKLLRGTSGDAGASQRLRSEARAMARLSHPNVVTVYEVGELDGQLFMAMEHVDGATLKVWQNAQPRTWRELLAPYLGAARGLAAAHAVGLIHRDFKPDNVMIGSDGRPRVGDFGVSTCVEATTWRHRRVGTPPYMAPEQWYGEEVDARSDQFAFCVAVWEAVFGERPFAGETPMELEANVLAGKSRPPSRAAAPGWLAPILARGLDRDRDKRWPSMTALIDELSIASTRARERKRCRRDAQVANTSCVVSRARPVTTAPSRHYIHAESV